MRITPTLATLVLTALLGVGTALAMGNNNPPANAANEDYKNGRMAVQAGEYDKGIDLLRNVVRKDPRNADALNYIGYAFRKKGDLDDAAKYYQAALKFDPKHKGALEYQGEMFLKMGRLADARGNLTKLVGLCPSGCEERAELERAINDYLAVNPGKGS